VWRWWCGCPHLEWCGVDAGGGYAHLEWCGGGAGGVGVLTLSCVEVVLLVKRSSWVS
jgi:hypothetical protein